MALAKCESLLQKTPPTQNEIRLSTVIPGYFATRVTEELRSSPDTIASLLRQLPIGPGGDERTRELIDEGGKLEKLILVVHQKDELQNTTAQRLLRDYTLTGLPRLFLVSNYFRALDHAFTQQASFIRYSSYGELGHAPVVDEVTLLGGYTDYCLGHSVRQLVEAAVRARQQKITLRFLTRYIYYANAGHRPFFQGEKELGEETFARVERLLLDRLPVVPELSSAELGDNQQWSGDFLLSDLRIHVILDRTP